MQIQIFDFDLFLGLAKENADDKVVYFSEHIQEIYKTQFNLILRYQFIIRNKIYNYLHVIENINSAVKEEIENLEKVKNEFKEKILNNNLKLMSGYVS